MALEDWAIIYESRQEGGQGFVQKVRHLADGRIGALKRLHGTTSAQTERRYRFLTEVGALRAMDGNGVPIVIEANEDAWRQKGIELYLVMEFIDGPTLTQLVQKSPPSLDDAIKATIRVVHVLGHGHRLPLHHRDLKPDNVIFRNGHWDEPVLVDLGIAWHGAEDSGGFQTPVGKELGNRFLRLPEFAPGGDHHDARSDLAMAAGLLFYMLSGCAPRVPVDHQGRHPHEQEPSPIRDEILKDRRWPRVTGLFQVAFQQRMEARFRDANEFSLRLVQVNEDPLAVPDVLEEEIARFHALTNSAFARERAEAAPAMQLASSDLCSELSRIWRDAGLQWGGQNPIFKDGGSANAFYCVVSIQGQTDPSIVFRHMTELRDGRLIATWSIDEGVPNREYEGSAADGAGLRDAMLASARKLAGQVIRQLNSKLEPGPTLAPFLK